MRTISPTSSLFGAQRSSTYQWHIYHWATLAMAPFELGKISHVAKMQLQRSCPNSLRYYVQMCRKITKNCCYQMSDFKAKIHQIRFRLGHHPRLHWGSAVFKLDLRGPTSKGREGKRQGRRECHTSCTPTFSVPFQIFWASSHTLVIVVIAAWQ